jgi:drug/metabolite transporter (DMT)-like permease
MAILITGVPLLLWSSQAVFMKSLLRGAVGSLELSLYRSAGALLLGLLLLRGPHRLPRRLPAYLPGVFLALNFITFNYALRAIDAYLLMVIETTSMFIGIAVDRALRVPTRIWWPAVALAGAGVVLLALDAGRSPHSAAPLGLLLAAATALTFALFNCTLRCLPAGNSQLATLMLPVLLLCLPPALLEIDTQALDWRRSLVALLVVGAVQTGVVYLLWARASAFFSGSALCQISMVTIPLTFIMEYLFLDLQPNMLQVVASAVLALAVLLNVPRQPASSVRTAATTAARESVA